MEFRRGHRTVIKNQSRRGCYILAYTGSRKNAKRHIIDRYDDFDAARIQMIKIAGSHPKWTVHIYNYCWEVLL